MNVQTVINGCSQDVRKILDSSVVGDQAALIDYTNRIQLQLLREARWRFLLSGVLQFTTVAGKTDYWIGATGGGGALPETGLNITNLGRVKPGTVFDRTNFKRLYPTDEAPNSQSFVSTARSLPLVYRNDQSTPGIFSVYPPAQDAYVIEFRYFFAKPQLTALTDILLIPNDYIDVVIAGVNWLTNLYLRESYTDAEMWKGIFDQGVQGMHRDHNLFPRGQEFMSPDPASRARSWVTPVGLDSGIETSMP